jgi:hypothetical protein
VRDLAFSVTQKDKIFPCRLEMTVFKASAAQDGKQSSVILSVSEESALRPSLADFNINGGQTS